MPQLDMSQFKMPRSVVPHAFTSHPPVRVVRPVQCVRLGLTLIAASVAWLGVALSGVALCDDKAAPSATTPADASAIKAAVEKAIPLLEAGARGSMEKRKQCFTCHNQGVPLMALTAARSRGFKIDEAHFAEQLAFTAAFLAKNRDNYREGKGQGGQVDTAGYALWTLATGGWKPDEATEAVVEYLLRYQLDTDHYHTTAKRPPTEQSSFTSTYVALRGLQAFGGATQRERIDARLTQLRSWLVKTKPVDNEERVFRLRGLVAIGANDDELKPAIDELLHSQRGDGGWRQLDDLEPDAYATASALVALADSGKVKPTDAAYRRGLEWLLAHQQPDGSWHVKSRSKPFQAYFESGYPHGKDQFISIAAAGWATLALTHAVEAKPDETKSNLPTKSGAPAKPGTPTASTTTKPTTATNATAASSTSARRVPWTGSRITGSPEPPAPYRSARAFPNATLKEPVLMVLAPGMDRFFVGERRGILYSLAKRADAKPEPALDLTTELKTFDRLPTPVKFDSLYAIAFHPKFKENRYCYVCYTLASTDKKIENLENGSRISRFKVTDTNPPKLDPASEEIVLTWLQGGHNGCELLFGPDGFLYVSTGDARPPSPPDSLHTGQDITDLMSSVLRIDVDRKQDGMNYAIPADNPFVGLKIDGKSARPEVWAYGFRNPWRMSFDRKTGELWLGDVGWELWEMVHRVEKGGNYGWSVLEGRQPVQTTDQLGPTPVRPPVIELPHTIAASITGGYIYRGSRFPELVGSYIFGDWEFRRLWSARLVDGKLESLTEITRPTVRVVTFGEDSDGELYYMDYDTGAIHTLERNDGAGQNKDFPTTLSATGLFSSVTEHAPAPGVIPYEINSPQWSDGASAVRWLALPGESGITVYPGQGKPMPSQVYWHSFRLHFPKDAVLLKTLSVEMQPGSAASRRRIETQVLHFDGADWRAYSYRWRDDESDADLVPAAGGERVLNIGGLLSDSVNNNSATTTSDAHGDASPREYVWQFNDRTQCMQCHSQWPQYAIGFSLSQLNREVSGGGEPSENQLVRLSRTGHLVRRLMDDKPDAPYDAKLVADEPRLADPREPASGGLSERARAYLHANCSHCHRFNGGGVVGLDLLFDKPIVATKTLEPPMRGDFGLPEARIIAPGHPERSTLYFRMSKFGRDRMPHVGSELPDEAGLTLIADWIRSLDPNAASGGRTAGGESIELPSDAELPAFLERPDESLRAARAVARRELSAAQSQRVLAAAAKLPLGPTRDLYDGYLPPDGKGRRLGPNPRPTLVTSLTGDVQRGKELFWAMSSKCASCHKVGDQGVNLGPELTAIGKKRSRDELLDSLLNPSRVVEPAFTAYQVTSGDGRSFTGLLVKRDAQQVVIRDVQNKEVTLPAADVERVQPSRTSLMPDGLLSQFTPQEAADLLAYLTARK